MKPIVLSLIVQARRNWHVKFCMRTDITNVSHVGIKEQETLSTSEQYCSLIGQTYNHVTEQIRVQCCDVESVSCSFIPTYMRDISDIGAHPKFEADFFMT